jgi:hypothetical protein
VTVPMITSTTPIRAPRVPAPTCRCRECILNPFDSHGLYTIGAYKVPSRLSLRGGRVTDPQVAWEIGEESGVRQHRMTAVFPNAQSDDDRMWLI